MRSHVLQHDRALNAFVFASFFMTVKKIRVQKGLVDVTILHIIFHTVQTSARSPPAEVVQYNNINEWHEPRVRRRSTAIYDDNIRKVQLPSPSPYIL